MELSSNGRCETNAASPKNCAAARHDARAWTPAPAMLAEGDPLPPADQVTFAMQKADLDQLYRGRAPRLVRHFAGWSRDGELALEVVQEAFARFASLSAPRRMTITKPESYLYRICVNLIREHRRSAALHRGLEAASDPIPETVDPLPVLEDRDQLRRLEAAIDRLKPREREVFLARRIDGMSHAEIASRTGLSAKGVEKQMAKAIAAIDRMMERS